MLTGNVLEIEMECPVDTFYQKWNDFVSNKDKKMSEYDLSNLQKYSNWSVFF